MTAKIDGTNGLLQQYDYQASTTGFSYTFAAGTTVLVMNPAGTLATGTITMPASPADGMTISFSSTQTITALTVNASAGQSIVGNPTTLLAGGAATFVYRLSNTTWYAQASTAAIGNTGAAAPVVRIYNSPSPWTKPTTLKAIKVTVVAGGGGGGTRGGGGGAAGYLFLQAPAIPGPVTVTVGAGGTGTVPPSPVPSPSGGTSSFGPLISATGGVGAGRLPGIPDSAGGTITPSPTVIGSPGQYSGATATNSGGASGLSFGYGGITSLTAAGGYGGGGSATPTTFTPFSNATAGVVVVEEFY